MKSKKVDGLLDEHFITRNEMRELVSLIEKLEQGIEHVKRSNRELKEDIVIINNESIDSLTFRMFIVISSFGFIQLIFKAW